MGRLFSKPLSWRGPFCRLYLLGIILLGCSLRLLANTPALLRSVPAGGCYCHCAESRPRGGCVKMCDSKWCVSRWRGAEEVKTHMSGHNHNLVRVTYIQFE